MSDLLERIEDGVATLTLNRPDRLNALSDDMITVLLEALDRLGQDSSVGAIVLTGAGRAFCAGGDIKTMVGAEARTPQESLDWIRVAHRIPLALTSCPKVTLACINGAAMGAGLGIALACDFRIANHSARFGVSFVKIALGTDFGVAWLLPRIIGEPRARELTLTGEIFDAQTASTMGLLTRLVDDDALLAETQSWAQRFARGPQVALANIKRNLLGAQRLTLSELLEYEAVQQVHVTQTRDHQEAVRAFLERRPATFVGA